MVDGRAMRQKLGSALDAQDPSAIANALQLPPISKTKQGQEPKSHNPQSLTVNDVDYSGLLTSLLDASAAAESVSYWYWLLVFNASLDVS